MASRVRSPDEPGCTIAIGVGKARNVGVFTDSNPSVIKRPPGVTGYPGRGNGSLGNPSASLPNDEPNALYQSLCLMLAFIASPSALTPSRSSATLKYCSISP